MAPGALPQAAFAAEVVTTHSEREAEQALDE